MSIAIGDKVRIQISQTLRDIFAELEIDAPDVDGQVGVVTAAEMGVYNAGELIIHVELEDGDVHELAEEDVVKL